MIVRRTLECLTCGRQTITRTAAGHGDYQEFAFPCGGCGLEIRYGMKLHLNRRMALIDAKREKKGEAWYREQMVRVRKMKTGEYVNLKNAKWRKVETGATDTQTFDGESLNPVNQTAHLSPFMATAMLPKDIMQFGAHQSLRHGAVRIYGPQIQRLAVHFERKQWALFDKQFRELSNESIPKTEAARAGALFNAAEMNGRFFSSPSCQCEPRIKQRIALAETASSPLVNQLAKFFQAKQKDESIMRQLWLLRSKWSSLFEFLFPVYTCYYWDDKQHTLDSYTLAQKRFDELKPFYVDCFETFCRVSVIAAALEGIILKGTLGVPTTKRVMSLDEFDATKNGSKPDILRHLPIGDLFEPFIDSKLRNGIGHNSAHYDVKTDTVHYVNENEKGAKQFQISYVRFCEKVVKLYGQLEAVSRYSHWLRRAAY